MRAEKTGIALGEALTRGGYQYKIISGSHIRDLQSEIEGQYRQGLFDEEFYIEELTGFDFEISENFTESLSLIIVAAPQPRVRVTFNRQGESHRAIIPPTYSYATDRHVQKLLEDHLHPAGFQVKKANSPWKLLAVRSGLARYGKTISPILSAWGVIIGWRLLFPILSGVTTTGMNHRCSRIVKTVKPA